MLISTPFNPYSRLATSVIKYAFKWQLNHDNLSYDCQEYTALVAMVFSSAAWLVLVTDDWNWSSIGSAAREVAGSTRVRGVSVVALRFATSADEAIFDDIIC